METVDLFDCEEGTVVATRFGWGVIKAINYDVITHPILIEILTTVIKDGNIHSFERKQVFCDFHGLEDGSQLFSTVFLNPPKWILDEIGSRTNVCAVCGKLTSKEKHPSHKVLVCDKCLKISAEVNKVEND